MNTTMQTKRDILDVIEENHSRIEALGVKRLGLFGSFVRENQRAESDIDPG